MLNYQRVILSGFRKIPENEFDRMMLDIKARICFLKRMLVGVHHVLDMNRILTGAKRRE